jgi:hypothetical protein
MSDEESEYEEPEEVEGENKSGLIFNWDLFEKLIHDFR